MQLMLWGHILLSLVDGKNSSQIVYLVCYTVVLVFTEILPFTMISINMVKRLKVYRRARDYSMKMQLSDTS